MRADIGETLIYLVGRVHMIGGSAVGHVRARALPDVCLGRTGINFCSLSLFLCGGPGDLHCIQRLLQAETVAAQGQATKNGTVLPKVWPSAPTVFQVCRLDTSASY